MATLEKIRRRSGLLIVVIGLAMAGFILTDLLGSGGILFNDYTNMGSINGEKIDRQDFALRMTKLRNSNPQYAQFSEKTIADAVWGQLERDIILGEQCEMLGLTITPEELTSIIKSTPEIANAFRNQSTGLFDEAAFANYIRNIEAAYNDGTNPQAAREWPIWLEYEKNVKKQSLANKYNTAVKYGVYIPTVIAEMEYAKTQSVQGNFVQLAFSSIYDSTVTFSEGDLKAYYKTNKDEFETEAMRNISYLAFNIVPSQEDKDDVLVEMNAMLENRTEGADTVFGFRDTDDDSTFVSMYSETPFDDKYYVRGELAPSFDTVMFNNPVGHVEGPSLDADNVYMMYKINSIINKPDSVEARHILISHNGVQSNNANATRTVQEAAALADSLYTLLQEDISMFDSVSKTYSDDAVAKSKGGELGWFDDKVMVPAFNKYCFRHKKGDIGLVYSEFGIHIVHITGTAGSNKAVRIASVTRAVLPSQTTIEDIHREASIFASEVKKGGDAEALAAEKGMRLRPANGLLKGDESVPGLSQNREIVKWAFGEERTEGDINVFSTTDRHITVILNAIVEEGHIPFEMVREDIESKVLNEKKSEMLIEKINNANASDLNALAQAVGGTVKPQAATMNGSALSGIGSEPKVIGTMNGMEPNTISAPIVGNSGVFVVSISERNPLLDKGDYSIEQQQLQGQIRGLVQTQIFNTLRDNADIDDKHNDIF